MGAIASQIKLFIQAQIKENIKAPCLWPLWPQLNTYMMSNISKRQTFFDLPQKGANWRKEEIRLKKTIPSV